MAEAPTILPSFQRSLAVARDMHAVLDLGTTQSYDAFGAQRNVAWGKPALGGVEQSARMLLLPLTAPWEMTYGNVQRAQSLARAYERNGFSGVFWQTVASMPVLGAVTAAVDAYREAYALPMTNPRDQARAAGQVTVPIAVAAVGVVGAVYGLAAGVGAARGGQGALVGTLRARAGQLAESGGLVGQNAQNVRTIASGRLKGLTRFDTDLPGGQQAAESLFSAFAGRGAGGITDRAVLSNGVEVVFRATSGTGVPKVEIVNSAAQTLEKITFR